MPGLLNPELTADAEAILERNGMPCDHVVAVDRDSILYVNQMGKARTAWLHHPANGPVLVKMEPGFVAEPPDGLHPPQAPTNYGLAAAPV